ncbi:hypothetical protein COO20_01625 [Thalassospira marina]|uniref:Uncharacterized protein n=1 Tax=Thalassospira marina TaxID=2048283 RepID=A0A2N3KZE7_9PROT|nr:hypothetical protein COO20_01625 [Thalassospira marina]
MTGDCDAGALADGAAEGTEGDVGASAGREGAGVAGFAAGAGKLPLAGGVAVGAGCTGVGVGVGVGVVAGAGVGVGVGSGAGAGSCLSRISSTTLLPTLKARTSKSLRSTKATVRPSGSKNASET